jgi:hypothetical protein
MSASIMNTATTSCSDSISDESETGTLKRLRQSLQIIFEIDNTIPNLKIIGSHQHFYEPGHLNIHRILTSQLSDSQGRSPIVMYLCNKRYRGELTEVGG